MSGEHDERQTEFEKRFDFCFPRVYAYLFRRTQDHATAERLTRDVLVRSLPEFMDGEDPALAAALLRAAQRSLRSEAASKEEPAHGSDSFPPTSAARPPMSLTRATSSPRSSQARRASGARRR